MTRNGGKYVHKILGRERKKERERERERKRKRETDERRKK